MRFRADLKAERTRASFASATLALVLLLAGCSAGAQPDGAASQRPNQDRADTTPRHFSAGPEFLFCPECASLVAPACVARPVVESALQELAGELVTDTGLEPQILVVVTTEKIGCGTLFYSPISNDIRGIGYAHEMGTEVFDYSPDSRLEGIAFLNDLPYWLAHEDEFSLALEHEVGHRWSARVHTRIDSEDTAALLGREGSHWSYFLDSAGSPLEGNAWTDLGDDHFVADSLLGTQQFSDLDLYLMGVMAPAEVRPARLLTASKLPPSALDCRGHAIGAASPPQYCEPNELSAGSQWVTIDQSVAIEGARTPTAMDHLDVDIAFVVLGANSALSSTESTALARITERSVKDFERASRGRVTLHNLSKAEGQAAGRD